jgi:tRNA pseudouridine55 synthase
MTESPRLRESPDNRSLADICNFGVVNLDKPVGPSAHQVSAWVRDLIGVERAAHAGTLDPKVTGCLPILLGEATRLAPVFLEGIKEYLAVLEFHGPPPSDLSMIIETFEGTIYQKPPRKSAVSRRLRKRTIETLDILEVDSDAQQALLRIRCESGTYIRKLCHDLGLAAGTGAHMGDLRRTGTTPFSDTNLISTADLTDAVVFTLEEIVRANQTQINDAPDDSTAAYSLLHKINTANIDPNSTSPTDHLRNVISPAERALQHLPTVIIAPSAAAEVAMGAPVYAPGVIEFDSAAGNTHDITDSALVSCHTPDETAVCLGRVSGPLDAESGEVISLERVLV